MPDQTPTAPVVGTLVNVGADGQHVELTVRLDIGTDVPDHLFDAPAVTVAAQVPPGPLADAIRRVTAYLDSQAGHAYVAGGQLQAADLQALVRAADPTGDPR